MRYFFVLKILFLHVILMMGPKFSFSVTPQRFQFQRLSLEEGLSQSIVRVIFKDSKGNDLGVLMNAIQIPGDILIKVCIYLSDHTSPAAPANHKRSISPVNYVLSDHYEGLSLSKLRELKNSWQDKAGNFYPSSRIWSGAIAELRRREKAGATKRKPLNHSFFEGK